MCVRPALRRHRPPAVAFPRIEVLLIAPPEELGAHGDVVCHDDISGAGGDDCGHLLLGDFFLGEPVDALGSEVLVDRRCASDPEPATRSPRPAMADRDLADVLGDHPQSVVPDRSFGERGPVLVVDGDEPQVEPERGQLRLNLVQVPLAGGCTRPEPEVAQLEDQVCSERLGVVDHLECSQRVHVQVAHQQDALRIGHGFLLDRAEPSNATRDRRQLPASASTERDGTDDRDPSSSPG